MQKKKLEAWLRVLEFNANHPVGTRVQHEHVIYGWENRTYRTQGPAVVIWRDWPVVFLAGKRGAVGLDKIRVLEAQGAEEIARPLLSGTHAFRQLLKERPGMTGYRLAVHNVHSGWFYPQAEHFVPALVDVMKRNNQRLRVRDCESIEHGPEVLCCRHTVQIGIVLHGQTAFRGQLIGRSERSSSGS